MSRAVLRALRSVVLSGGILLANSTAALAQCAMCKEALESGQSDAARYARGVYWSILFLGGVLLMVTGGVVYLVVRHGRTIPAPPPPASPTS